MQNLQGKTAIVTGAARRIGAEIASLLHAEGMNVLIHYNLSQEEALELCEKLNALRPHSASVYKAELNEEETAAELIHYTHKQWGRIDALINNASRFYKTPFGQVTNFAWDDLITANLKAPFFLAQAAAPYLTRTAGCIVNITDFHADRPLRHYPVYCISKSGLVMMTKLLAKELGPAVRVNAVAPGAIIWPEGENDLTEEEKAKIIAQTTLQRVGSPADIAKTVLFFVRDAAYITGQVLVVDGGRTISA